MPAPHAISIVDLAYGDCGKGTLVDFLARQYPGAVVVRFNGGPQAGHNVVTSDGRHHTFSQFGAGTLVAAVGTLLSRFMLIEPYALFNEAAHLRSIGVAGAMKRLLIDARCPVIAPPHQAANRLRELARGAAAHGTCGVGVGEVMQDLLEHPELMLHAADLSDRARVARRLRAIRDLKVDQMRDAIADLRSHPHARFSIDTLLDASWIDAAVDTFAALAVNATLVDEAAAGRVLRETQTLILEGAQGVLLDENHGFHPHTTWSTTTFANAEALLNEAGRDGKRTRIGVLRSYFTRHGHGPLVTEEARLDLPEPHNGDAGWQGRFRVGFFDAVAVRYALDVAGGVDGLAITHVDRIGATGGRVCNEYCDDSEAPRNFRFSIFDLRSEPEQGATAGSENCKSQIANRKFGNPSPLPSPLGTGEREKLTRALGRCRPKYTQIDPGDRAICEWISAALQTPIAITSYGPTAEDKRIAPGWFS